MEFWKECCQNFPKISHDAVRSGIKKMSVSICRLKERAVAQSLEGLIG